MQLEACLLDFQQKFAIAATTYIYNCTFFKCFKWKTPQEIFLDNKPKTLHFCIFGYETYVFLPNEICTNKLMPYFNLMIFIRDKKQLLLYIPYTRR